MTRDDFKIIEELRKDFVSYKKEIFKFKFHQVYHKDGWYIYQVNDNWFEVFKETIANKLMKVNGELTHSDEIGKVRYPSGNDFGFWAWNVVTMEDALAIIAKKSLK